MFWASQPSWGDGVMFSSKIRQLRSLRRKSNKTDDRIQRSAGFALPEPLEPRTLMSFSLWSDAATPAVASSSGVNGPVEVGVKFYSDVDGYVSGVRFYKGSLNTGAHFGSL